MFLWVCAFVCECALCALFAVCSMSCVSVVCCLCAARCVVCYELRVLCCALFAVYCVLCVLRPVCANATPSPRPTACDPQVQFCMDLVPVAEVAGGGAGPPARQLTFFISNRADPTKPPVTPELVDGLLSGRLTSDRGLVCPEGRRWEGAALPIIRTPLPRNINTQTRQYLAHSFQKSKKNTKRNKKCKMPHQKKKNCSANLHGCGNPTGHRLGLNVGNWPWDFWWSLASIGCGHHLCGRQSL